jgi:four helix bundle protein
MDLPVLAGFRCAIATRAVEVVMAKQYRFRFKEMDVYQAAVDHFVWTVQVVRRLPRGPFVIPDQFIGASLSIVGNVAEAKGREKKPGEVEQHYRYAQGSTFESASYLDVLSALDAITDEEYNTREDHLARIASMLTRLMQSQRTQRRPPHEKRGPQARAPKSRASGAEKPAPAGAEKPAPAGAEKPAPAGAEKPAPAGAEKPAPAGAEKPRSGAHPGAER